MEGTDDYRGTIANGYVVSPFTGDVTMRIDFSEAIIDDHITFAKITVRLVNGGSPEAWH